MRSKYRMIPPVRMTPEKEKMMDKVFKNAYSNKLKRSVLKIYFKNWSIEKF